MKLEATTMQHLAEMTELALLEFGIRAEPLDIPEKDNPRFNEAVLVACILARMVKNHGDEWTQEFVKTLFGAPSQTQADLLAALQIGNAESPSPPDGESS
jgi:hypothetical protein